MARLASPQKSPRKNNPDTQDTLCAALLEVSSNKVSTKAPPKLIPSSSPRKAIGTTSGHADEQSSSSRRQRVFRLEHVDSLTLPSLNGISSKSYKQNLLFAHVHRGQNSERSPLRATPRRMAKQAISYAVPGIPGLQAELSDSDWSGSEQSEDEKSEGESDQPRLLWRSPSKPMMGEVLAPTGIVDLTSPAKSPARNSAAPSQPQSPRRRSSTLDSLEENLAILSFSPPRSRSPHKLKAAPPAPPARPVTPPPPPPSPPRSRLNSPSKASRIRIPPAPHAPDVDAFWSQEIVNAWTDEYSPTKVLASPRKQYFGLDTQSSALSPSAPPSPAKSRVGSPRKSPTKQSLEVRAVTAAKKAFEASREATATAFLAELDARITNGAIARLTASTGGVKIVWSNKLNTTAGRATWKCETTRPKPPSTNIPSTSTSTVLTVPAPTQHHHATIELASKVITDNPRLLNVMAHEFCHLANFMVSNIRDQPHGASFKRWAAMASREFGARGVEVTTKHSYEIEYRYGWVCVGGGRRVGMAGGEGGHGCGMEYQRHSKSIDPAKHTCGVCKGRLVQIRPIPRGTASTTPASSTLTLVTGLVIPARSNPAAPPSSAVAPSAYQQFVKAHFALVRQDLGAEKPMSEIMREVGARYRASKAKAGVNLKGIAGRSEGEGEKETKGGARGQVEVIEISDSEDEVEVVGHKNRVEGGLGLEADVEIDVDVTVADEDGEEEGEQDEFVDVDDLDELELPEIGRLGITDD